MPIDLESLHKDVVEAKVEAKVLTDRVNDMHGRMMVMESRISDLVKIPELLVTIRETVSGLRNQVKVTWALLVIIIVAMIGTAIGIMAASAGP